MGACRAFYSDLAGGTREDLCMGMGGRMRAACGRLHGCGVCGGAWARSMHARLTPPPPLPAPGPRVPVPRPSPCMWPSMDISVRSTPTAIMQPVRRCATSGGGPRWTCCCRQTRTCRCANQGDSTRPGRCRAMNSGRWPVAVSKNDVHRPIALVAQGMALLLLLLPVPRTHAGRQEPMHAIQPPRCASDIHPIHARRPCHVLRSRTC